MIEVAHYSKKYIDPATGEDCTRHTRYYIRKAKPEDYKLLYMRNVAYVLLRQCSKEFDNPALTPITFGMELLNGDSELHRLLISLNDTDYWQASGDHPLFVATMTQVQTARAIDAEREVDSSRLRGLDAEHNDRYIAELKRRRIYSKAAKDQADAALIDQIRKEVLAALEAEKAALRQRLEDHDQRQDAAWDLFVATVAEWKEQNGYE